MVTTAASDAAMRDLRLIFGLTITPKIVPGAHGGLPVCWIQYVVRAGLDSYPSLGICWFAI